MGDEDLESGRRVGLTPWLEWTRSRLEPSEIGAELSRLSASDRRKLENDHWVWLPGLVLWLDPGGSLRRARFTHGTHFRTAKGEFHIDSGGRLRRVSESHSGS